MTYLTLKKFTTDKSLPFVATNTRGKKVLIDRGINDNGEYYQIMSPVSKDKCKVQRFYRDGKLSETYSKW